MRRAIVAACIPLMRAMPNTALNRTVVAILTNKSGGDLAYGDVVILNNTDANGFTTTTTAGLSTRGLGVIQDVNGIANNASGMVAVGGWVAQINLNTASTVGQFIKTHTVAGQGTPHSSPQVEGDFAVALTASATPAAVLFGSPNGPSSGGGGDVTAVGTLDADTVILGDGSTDVKSLANGTAGQVLTMNGGATAPEWATPSGGGGGLVLVEQHTASNSASLDFTTGITSTYDDYVIRYTNLLPQTSAQALRMQFSTDGGANYDSGNNYQDFNFRYGTNASATAGATAGTGIDLTFSSDASLSNTASKGGVSGQCTLVNPLSGVINTQVTGGSGILDAGTVGAFTGLAGIFAGHYTVATAVNAFRVLFDSGNIVSGVVRLYGVEK